MLTRLRSFLLTTVAQLGELIEATVHDDRARDDADRPVRVTALDPSLGLFTIESDIETIDDFHRAARGHGLSEAARRHVEAGAERLPRHSVSGRDPP